MDQVMRYVLGAIVCGMLFVTFYRTVLYGRVPFRMARLFLIASIVVSALIPALNIPVWTSAPIEVPYIMEPMLQVYTPIMTAQTSVNWLEVGIWALYGSGVAMVLGVMGWQISKIHSLRRTSRIERIGKTQVAVNKQVGAPFSFLGTIYITESVDELETQRIVMHEWSHIRHRHSVEKIAVQVLTALVWWNPAAWWALRLLCEVHEFEADNDVLRSGCTVDEYLPLIFRQVFGVIPEISVGLAHSLTKKRFEMMRKNLKQNKLSALRVAGALPLIGVGMMLFGFTHRAPEIVYVAPENEQTTTTSEVEQVDENTTKIAFTNKNGESVEAVVTVNGDEAIFEGLKGTVTKVTLKSVEPGEDEPIMNAEVMPKFQGGDIVVFRNWVMSNVTYPEAAKEQGIGGRVVVKFVVDKSGQLTNVEGLQSPSESLTAEVARVLRSSPKWTPGTQEGKPVSVFYILPVDFTLMGDNEPTDGIETKDVIVLRHEKTPTPESKDAVVATYETRETVIKSEISDDVLLVVDGKKVKNLDNLDANSIESIEVLKGEAAVKEYGKKAANGVILVTTKKEMIDIGYGQVEKKKNTSAVGTVDMSEVAGYSDLKRYIQGRVAGVSFQGNQLIIRGTNSINSGIEALIVVDGVPMNSFEDANMFLNPADIASISVLKDAGSTAVYGTRGANGVVLIRTKRGGE